MKKLILILTLLCSSAFAEHDRMTNEMEWVYETIPVACSDYQNIKAYAEEEKLEGKKVYIGRKDGLPNGTPQFIITVYENEDGKEAMVTVTVPSTNTTCIMYRVFDGMEIKKKKGI